MQISEGLQAGAIAEIEAQGATYDVVEVPGALEIPAAIKSPDFSGKYDGYERRWAALFAARRRITIMLCSVDPRARVADADDDAEAYASAMASQLHRKPRSGLGPRRPCPKEQGPRCRRRRPFPRRDQGQICVE